MTREIVEAVTIHHISEERVTFDVHMSGGRIVAIDWESDNLDTGWPLYHLCGSLGIAYLEDTDQLIGRAVLPEEERKAFLFAEGWLFDSPGQIH